MSVAKAPFWEDFPQTGRLLKQVVQSNLQGSSFAPGIKFKVLNNEGKMSHN